MNETLQTIKNGRSIRSYLPEQIKDEELALIIGAGIYAPTANNDQPWHFTIIQNREKIKYISDKTKDLMSKSETPWMKNMGLNPKMHISYNAPTLIIVSGNKAALAPKIDCSAAIENMLIASESLNIGSVWLGVITFFFKLEEEVKNLVCHKDMNPITVWLWVIMQ